LATLLPNKKKAALTSQPKALVSFSQRPL